MTVHLKSRFAQLRETACSGPKEKTSMARPAAAGRAMLVLSFGVGRDHKWLIQLSVILLIVIGAVLAYHLLH